MGFLKSTSIDLTKGVIGNIKGDPVAKIGVGKLDSLIPNLNAVNIDNHIEDFQGSGQPQSMGETKGSTFRVFDGAGTGEGIETDGTINFTGNAIGFDFTHSLKTGDKILYSGNENADHDYIPGLQSGKHYYVIVEEGVNTSFKVAKTLAKAQANEPITFHTDRFYDDSGTKGVVFRYNDNVNTDATWFKINNALFDHGTKLPNRRILNYFPYTSTDNRNYNYSDLASPTVPQWRRHSGLLTNGSFRSFAGSEWLHAHAPFQPISGESSGADTIAPRQSKVLKLFGSTTLTPDNVGYLVDPGQYSGFFNLNVDRNFSGSGIERVVSHATGADNTYSSDLAGNSDAWVMHEWYQNLYKPGKVIRKGGKIKFGVKVRVDQDDLLRLNDFGGMYIQIRYPTAYGRNHVGGGVEKIHTAYFQIKRAASNINFSTAGSAYPFHGVGKPINDNSYSSSGAFRRGVDTGQAKSIELCKTINVEDIGSFTEIECEIDVPSDLMDILDRNSYYTENGISVKPTHYHGRASYGGINSLFQGICVRASLYFADNCGNLMGMDGGDETNDPTASVDFNNDIAVGERCYVDINDLDSTTQIGVIKNYWEDVSTMGFENDGQKLTDYDTHRYTGSSASLVRQAPPGCLIRKKANTVRAGSANVAARRVLNDNQIRSNGLVANEPYFIDSLEGITQAEMHTLAGTTAGDEISASDMVPGEVYTISHMGTNTTLWEGVEYQNEAFNSQMIGSLDRTLGFAFKFENYNGFPLSGISIQNLRSQLESSGAKVTKGGYPKYTIFVPRNTTSDQKGYFTRTSGSIQFFSPFVEYIPPTSDPDVDTVNMEFAFGGATIGEGNVYEEPSSAQSWAGFANSNNNVYPYRFYGKSTTTHGGRISFTAATTGSTSVQMRFVFNHLPYTVKNANSPPNLTKTITLTGGSTPTNYTIDIAKTDNQAIAHTSSNQPNTFHEALMYIDSADEPVTLTNIVIEDFT